MRICSVDIEAHYRRLLFVGTKEIVVEGNRIRYLRYRPFHRADLLHSYLTNFNGLLIGHNWLRRDLVTLAEHFDVSDLVPKSTDTLLILKSRNDGSYSDMSLESLATQNFALTKAHKRLGEKVFDIWRSDRLRAYRHNHLDCYLAFRLWFQLITRREICTYGMVRMRDGSLHARYLTLDDTDVRSLVEPRFTYRAWKRWKEEETEMVRTKRCSEEYRPV